MNYHFRHIIIMKENWHVTFLLAVAVDRESKEWSYTLDKVIAILLVFTVIISLYFRFLRQYVSCYIVY